MATKKDTVTTQDAGDSAAREAAQEVADRLAPALEQGFIGSVPDPVPNSAYSLQSGPDAPALVPDDRTRVDQPAAAPGPGLTKKEG